MRRPHGQAVVDPENPQQFALCDRCGRQFNRCDLSWQKQWAGPSLILTGKLVCAGCLDEPAPFQRTIVLPVDPPPVYNARHETPLVIDGANKYTVQTPPGKPMFSGNATFAVKPTVTNFPKSILTGAPAGVKYLGTFLGNSAPNNRTFSVSYWFKSADVTRAPSVFRCETVAGSDLFRIVNSFDTDVDISNNSNPGVAVQSAWNDGALGTPGYIPLNTWTHMLFAVDTTQAVAADRIKIYKNGVLSPTYYNLPCAQNSIFPDFMITGTQLVLGSQSSASRYVGRLAFYQIIDGAQIAPTDVAQNVAGTWSHKPYRGSFGPTGFYFAGDRYLSSKEGYGKQYTFAVTGSNISLDKTDVPPYVSY